MTAKVRLPGATVATVVTICTDTADPVRWSVWDGVAPPSVDGKFCSVFPLADARQTPSLAAEDWGTLDARFQIACFGESVAQAVWLSQQIISADWPNGWDLVGPDDQRDPVVDPAPAPAWQYVPLTFRYHG